MWPHGWQPVTRATRAAATAGQAKQAAGGGHACRSRAEDRGPGRNAHWPWGPRGLAVTVGSDMGGGYEMAGEEEQTNVHGGGRRKKENGRERSNDDGLI